MVPCESTAEKVLLEWPKGFVHGLKSSKNKFTTLFIHSKGFNNLILLFNLLSTSPHTSSDRMKIPFRKLSYNFETAPVSEETGRSAEPV